MIAIGKCTLKMISTMVEGTRPFPGAWLETKLEMRRRNSGEEGSVSAGFAAHFSDYRMALARTIECGSLLEQGAVMGVETSEQREGSGQRLGIGAVLRRQNAVLVDGVNDRPEDAEKRNAGHQDHGQTRYYVSQISVVIEDVFLVSCRDAVARASAENCGVDQR